LPRKTVTELLTRLETTKAYSNIILDNALTKAKLVHRDKALASVLFYGVIERRITLDFVIGHCSNIPFDEINPVVKQILRIGFYQLLYMDKIPESAAVNECVNLAPISAKGFVNGILRNFIRNGKCEYLQKLLDGFPRRDILARLETEYSCPLRLVRKWNDEYGEQKLLQILQSSLGRPPVYLRVNSVRFGNDDVIAELAKDGVIAQKCSKTEDCLEIESIQTPLEISRAYIKGMFHVQDISSQICCKIARPEWGGVVIDICAAPGGKTFTMAEIMTNRGRLISCDLYDGKISVIREGAKRLGLSIIEPLLNDARRFNPDFPQADNVICDVPCSGLGVIRRKPEIKYKTESFDSLTETQYKILETSSGYVKAGGTLIYSTCTLSKAENEDVADRFTEEHPEFSPVAVPSGVSRVTDSPRHTFFPDVTGGDGFFVAAFRKTK
jgi:16S rRNA (cytosine967-C5)-methyltransferase